MKNPLLLERINSLLELRLPLELPVFAQAVLDAPIVQNALGIGRLHQPAEDALALLAVEVLDLLVDALPDQVADADALEGNSSGTS